MEESTKMTTDSWYNIRQEVLHRDDYICQSCLVKRAEHVHHIIPRRKIALDLVNNLVSLCHKCHVLLEFCRSKGHYEDHTTTGRLKRSTIDLLKKQGAYGMTLDDIVCLILADRTRNAKGGNN